MNRSVRVHYLTDYDENHGNDSESRRRLLGGHSQWYDRHLEDLLYEDKSELNYVMNTSGIFPCDLIND